MPATMALRKTSVNPRPSRLLPNWATVSSASSFFAGTNSSAATRSFCRGVSRGLFRKAGGVSGNR